MEHSYMTMQDLVDTGMFLGVGIFMVLFFAVWFARP